ncbi:MAG: hypothetical protein JXA57_18825 [Armatimonadetes bacterium]|nr:hypothetical protein [Armatimonadota bacterium]
MKRERYTLTDGSGEIYDVRAMDAIDLERAQPVALESTDEARFWAPIMPAGIVRGEETMETVEVRVQVPEKLHAMLSKVCEVSGETEEERILYQIQQDMVATLQANPLLVEYFGLEEAAAYENQIMELCTRAESLTA